MADADFTLEELASEEWHDARNYGDMIYQVSNLGRVRSVRVKILMPQLVNGYRRAIFWDKRRKAANYESVHSLVAGSFIGERPKGQAVNHKDGEKQNNRAANLEYCSYKQNALHAVSLGLWYRGEDNGSAKLTNKQAKQIIQLLADGSPVRFIAQQFSISSRMVRLIERGALWKHLARPVVAASPRTRLYKSGVDCHKAKLSEDDIRTIRMLYSTSNYTLRDLGNLFPVCISSLSRIVRRTTWKNVR